MENVNHEFIVDIVIESNIENGLAVFFHTCQQGGGAQSH